MPKVDKHWPPYKYGFVDDEGHLYVRTFEIEKNTNAVIYDIFNRDGIFITRMAIDQYADVDRIFEITAKRNRLYYYREKESGYKELVVCKMQWE